MESDQGCPVPIFHLFKMKKTLAGQVGVEHVGRIFPSTMNFSINRVKMKEKRRERERECVCAHARTRVCVLGIDNRICPKKKRICKQITKIIYKIFK